MKPHFRIFGFPVRVEGAFLFTALILWTLNSRGGALDNPGVTLPIWVAVMFVGVLAHELGHAVAGKAFGLTPKIALHGMGGVTSFERGRRLGHGRSVVVSVAGPFVGIVIGSLAYYAATQTHPLPGSPLEYTLDALVWVNAGWGILNLIPMLPLDGGHVVASVLQAAFPKKGMRLARIVSLVVAAALIALAISTGTWINALLVASFAMQNVRALRLEHAIGDDIQLRGPLTDAFDALERGDGEKVTELARKMEVEATTAAMRAQVAQLLAWGAFLRGQMSEAREALKKLPEDVSPDPALDGAIALALGEPDTALGKLVEALETRGGDFVEKRFIDAVLATKRYRYAAAILGGAAGEHVSTATLFKIEHAAYEAGDFESAAKVGQELFKKTMDPLRAYNVACSLAKLGQTAEAMDWLMRAKETGFSDGKLADEDVDLAEVRELSRYRAFRDSLGEAQ